MYHCRINALSESLKADTVLACFQYLVSGSTAPIVLDTNQLPSSEDVVEIVSSRDAQSYYVVTRKKVCVCVYVGCGWVGVFVCSDMSVGVSMFVCAEV